MPTIWGFNLGEMRFSKFGSGALMADGYHLRKERIILYQVAMLTCLAAECTATYSLSKYESLQGRIENSPLFGGHLYQNDIIDCEIVTIVVVARHSAVLSGLAPEVARAAVEHYSRPPLKYSEWAVNIAYVVVLWVGLLAVVAATAVMFLAVEYDYLHDPSLLPSPSPEDPSLTAPGERADMRQAA